MPGWLENVDQGHALCNRSPSATPRLPLWAASRATRHPSAWLTRAGLAAGAAAANVVPSTQVRHCVAFDDQLPLTSERVRQLLLPVNCCAPPRARAPASCALDLPRGHDFVHNLQQLRVYGLGYPKT